ncbi:unnamed protein product, partial [Phaeothamnion confervicola]
MMAGPADAVDKAVLDDKARFSETVLWQLQRAYYEQNAVKCWQECVVPNFVTSNGFIAHGYARTIVGFLRDYLGGAPSPDDDDDDYGSDCDDEEAGGNSSGNAAAEAAGFENGHREGNNSSDGTVLPKINGVESAAGDETPSARTATGSIGSADGDSDRDAEDEPVYIIELGAGSAKLSYVLVQKLLRLEKYLPSRGGSRRRRRANPCGADTNTADRGSGGSNGSAGGKNGGNGIDGGSSGGGGGRHRGRHCFKYVITDFGAGNFDFWLNHPRFQPLFEAGVLDVGSFDAEAGGVVRLALSGVELRPGRLRHPVVAVANYVFDTLRHDAFQVRGGALEEVLCTTVAAGGTTLAPTNPELLRYMKCLWSSRSCEATGSYEDPRWNRVLVELCEGQRDASFLMPVGALRAIENTRALSRDGRLLVLAGDKGYVSPRELEGVRDPHVAMHGSFSCMVNFRALELYCRQEPAGFQMHGGHLDGFKCCLFAFGLAPEVCPQARAAFREGAVGFGPDGFSSLQRCLKEEGRGLSLRTAMAVLRLSHFDADVFYKFKQVFIDKGPYATEKLQEDIRRDMLLVYDCYYPLQPSKDVAFELGRIFMGLKDFEAASAFFRDSQRFCGVHHVSWYNMGVCHYYLNQLGPAEECFDHSLGLCPDYPDALKWRDKVHSLQDYLGPPLPPPPPPPVPVPKEVVWSAGGVGAAATEAVAAAAGGG